MSTAIAPVTHAGRSAHEMQPTTRHGPELTSVYGLNVLTHNGLHNLQDLLQFGVSAQRAAMQHRTDMGVKATAFAAPPGPSATHSNRTGSSS